MLRVQHQITFMFRFFNLLYESGNERYWILRLVTREHQQESSMKRVGNVLFYF